MDKRTFSTKHAVTWGDYNAQGIEDGTIHLWKSNKFTNEPIGRDATISQAEAKVLAVIMEDQKDLDLGRWRSEMKPHMVAYPMQGDDLWVRVVDERNGDTKEFSRKWKRDIDNNDFEYVAEFYFRQHPPIEPWHKAEHGDVWLIHYKDGEASMPFTMDRSEPEIHKDGVFRNLETYMSGKSESISDAEKLYPKE